MVKTKPELGKDPIIPLFFKYYIPTLLSLLSVTVHQVVDGIILGHYVGKEGVAAVGLFGPIITIFIAFALAIVIGGGISFGKSIGSKDYISAQKIFEFTTTWIGIFGILIIVSFPFFIEGLTMYLAGGEDVDLISNTYDYLFWSFLWIPFFLLRVLWGNFISHDGAPKASRNASFLGAGLNIVLDVLFVIGFEMGTEGAAIATGISVLTAALYLMIYVIRKGDHLSFKLFHFRIHVSGWKQLLKYGIPSLISEIAFSFGILLINRSVIPLGAVAISIFGIINHLSFIFLRLFTAAMTSVIPIMSFNIGAGQPKRVLATLKFALAFTAGVGLFVSMLGLTFGDELISIFSGAESEEFKNLAGYALGWFFLFFLAAGPNYILSAYFQSIGKVTLSIVMNLLKGFVLTGFYLYLIDYLFHADLQQVLLSRPFAEICTVLTIGAFSFIFRVKYFGKAAILNQ